jgi:hypothetical protein
MSKTVKPPSQLDGNQTLQNAFNDVDSTITTNGFLVGKVGRKIELSISTTTVANDTETYEFSEDGEILYTLRVIYTNGSRETLLSAERIG